MDFMRPCDFRRGPGCSILMGRREDRLLSRWRTGRQISLASCSPVFATPRFTGSKETAMFNLKIKLATAAIAVASAASFASPAIAGQCAVPGTNALANAPATPKDVTDTVIGSVDL